MDQIARMYEMICFPAGQQVIVLRDYSERQRVFKALLDLAKAQQNRSLAFRLNDLSIRTSDRRTFLIAAAEVTCDCHRMRGLHFSHVWLYDPDHEESQRALEILRPQIRQPMENSHESK